MPSGTVMVLAASFCFLGAKPSPDPSVGTLTSYRSDPALAPELHRYGLKAGVWTPPPAAEGVKPVHWVMYAPPKPDKSLPLVLFLPGKGELGTDLKLLFRQRLIFDVVTSKEFQARHPCYLFAPMTDKDVDLHCWEKGVASPGLAAVYGSLAAVVKALKKPGVDETRVYSVGLSSGGCACAALMYAYPHVFAASMPVAGALNPELFSDKSPVNMRLCYNPEELAAESEVVDFDEVENFCALHGGDFAIVRLTGSGHNAWDRAWSEPGLWDWMFGKSTAGDVTVGKKAKAPPARPSRFGASQAPASDRETATMGGDGLETTVYASKFPARKGDWWCIEFDKPFHGTVTVFTGEKGGKRMLRRGVGEISRDGEKWTRSGGISRGEVKIAVSPAARFVRVLVTGDQDDPLVVREIRTE